MKKCLKCKGDIPSVIIVDGKRKNLASRKYCLDCSPFLGHNTKKLSNIQIEKMCCACKKIKPLDEYRCIKGKSSGLFRSLCKDCDNDLNYKSQLKRGIDRKRILIEQAGGKCSKCGYDENSAVLHFHHRDPATKSFGLTTSNIRGMKIENALAEAKKCDLLCANCHMETHHPHLNDKL